ncbi:polysaccharide biosynthesis/export family protein [Desulfovibrio oxyclinae]|uniref:polysaccharide biosynthesis/export family protein n=1 Tax=Desulfovibrio oxyclinae TaxID=63560 RepID=UPI0003705B41|nr:polysaccharide biosynthesis/export family protein [Desulfovibrio oxyclinae]
MKSFIYAFCLVLALAAPCFASDYTIGEGDALSIQVWGEDELQTQTVVRPDGKISMPGIEDVHAAGLTVQQLKKKLYTELSDLVREPLVNISLLNSASSKVYIVGGGVESRVFDLTQRTTLLHLLASLGSLAAADLHEAYVYRDGEKVMQDFHALFTKGDFESDIKLEPGDTVFIPLKENMNVFVLGAVAQPKAIFCREGFTVLDALLEAGSFNKYANEDTFTIVRKNGDERERIEVDANKLIKKGDLSENVLLQPGDYIIVRESFF